jgi:hypothetical protein
MPLAKEYKNVYWEIIQTKKKVGSNGERQIA